MFTLATHGNAEEDSSNVAGIGDTLFIPPVTGFRDESKPLEAVHFLRDEGANRVFGVEHTVLNGIGRPVDGFDAQRERLERIRAAEGPATEPPSAAAQSASGAPAYRLMSRVAENWIPFDPVRASEYLGFSDGHAASQIRLWRRQMLRNVDGLASTPIPAMTYVLSLAATDPLLCIEEAAVPRAGQRLQLTAQRVRWVDGKTYVWVGRKVLAGRGEGSSGLRFDRFGG
jgi:hypothetical protein